MREAAPRYGNLTFEEYLAIEASSDVRHEFVAGTLYAMAGASRRHNDIVSNLLLEIGGAARRQGCKFYTSDMLTRVDEVVAYYPDISVICDPTDRGQRYIQRPCLVVEVTSPSTADRDQREKLLLYRGIATLESYVIVFQNERRVIHHQRAENGGWNRLEIVDDGILELTCPGIAVSIDIVYSGVSFDDPETDRLE